MSNYSETLEARTLLAATGVISGSVYTDLNANATHEAGEAGIKKARVYLDANNNGAWDSKTETSVLTSKRGEYEFDNLKAGTYRLREVADTNTTIVSAPRSSWFRITLADGQHVARRMFANLSVTRIPGQTGQPEQFIHATAIGDTDTLVKYTYSGDSDLNGVVNFDDYSRVDSGFNNNGSNWLNGDFDYNGVVEFDDYALIDQAFNTQTGTLDRAITYLDGSDRSNQGMDTPALHQLQDHLAQFGQGYADKFLSTVAPPPAAAPSIKSIARADFKLTHNDHSLLSAKSWLSGDKDVIRSSGLQTVIDHYHQYGTEYKRAFLKLASDY